MSPVREMKDGRGKCIFYGSLPQETGGLTPMDDDDDDDDDEDNNEKPDDDCLRHKAKEDFTIEGERNYFIYFVICYFYFYLFLKL